MTYFIDRTCLFYGLNCHVYRPNGICYRLNCNVYRPYLHISGRFLGGPPGPGCWLGPVGAGRGRSGPVGDGNAGGGPRNVRNSGSAGTVGSVGCAQNMDRRAIFID